MHADNSKYRVIGLMSGTSLDGLDIAACILFIEKGKWFYEISHATTLPYSSQWHNLLKDAPNLSGEALIQLHKDYGTFCGEQCKAFALRHDFPADFIASHGHTIFHRPDLGYTFQVGSGASISASSGITSICDFRSQDVAKGGQGAPLVPMGDQLLFGDYDACLNLGGFSNISMELDGRRVAWDICPVNIILNHLAQLSGKEFDENGNGSAQGALIKDLFQKLNVLPFYSLSAPKSLGREWVQQEILPLLKEFKGAGINDLLHTFTEHSAYQISKSLSRLPSSGRVLVSGGGARNTYLMKRLAELSHLKIELAPDPLLDYKEALIFALLAVLRYREENNILASVSGANADHSSGSIFLP